MSNIVAKLNSAGLQGAQIRGDERVSSLFNLRAFKQGASERDHGPAGAKKERSKAKSKRAGSKA